MMDHLQYWEPLCDRRKEARLTTMFKITHDIIETEKSRLTLGKETRIRGSHTFKYQSAY